VRPSKLARLVRNNLARDLRGMLASAFGVTVGIACLVFFLGLGRGVQGVVQQVFPTSTREIDVVLPQVALGSLLGEAKLDDAAVARLQGLPGIEQAFPKMQLRIPAGVRYHGLFFGREIHMGLEVIGVGVPRAVAESDAKLPFVDPGRGKPIPILVNRRLMEIYNKVFAPQRGLPRLTESMLIGFQVPIELGKSWVAGQTLPGTYTESLQLAGFSDRAVLAGVTMPLEAVQRINKEFGQDASSYSSVLLRARASSDIPGLVGAVKSMGLEVDDAERSRALQIGAAIQLVTAALGLLSALITALAAVNIAHALFASVRERTREIGVLRAVGASQRDVAALILVEAAVIGLCGGVLGVILGRLAAALVDRLARTGLPEFPFKPDSFFAFSPGLLLLGVAVAVFAALFGAFFPARAAAALDPARALSTG
jgi:ABC-type antimicrobial peptide transport system permease subunit